MADQTTFRAGVLLVIGATLCWSIGGTIDRFITIEDSWVVVFWRSLFAGLFILGFMLARDGVAGTAKLLAAARGPSIIVGICYAISTICFILALSYTSVAKVLLIQAAVPIAAAAISWVLLREKVPVHTMFAIATVVAGIAVIFSGSAGQSGSILGDVFASAIVLSFALSVVITRKYPGIRMTPAVLLGVAIAGVIAFFMSGPLAVNMRDLGFLALFGMVNLGLGLALFVTGARLIPSVLSALLSVIEPILGPIWVWLVHGETPTQLVLVGGAIVMGALCFNMYFDWRAANKVVRLPAK